MPQDNILIPMPDGEARTHIFRPDGPGPWPAVILFMDGLAIRPALFEMGERLASAGYFVLLPDMFWRIPPYPPADAKAALSDPAAHAEIMSRIAKATSFEKAMRDTGTFIDWLAGQNDVVPGPIGVTGYCLGGNYAIRAAGTYPDKIAAAASFHASMLATDAEDSPHLLAPKIRARVIVRGADEDKSFDAEQCQRLSRAFEASGADAQIGIYTGARHGWVPSDTPVHNPAAAERHWEELLQLLAETLPTPRENADAASPPAKQ